MEKTGRALFVYENSENTVRNLNLAFNKYKDLKVVIFKTVADEIDYSETVVRNICSDFDVEVIDLDLSEIFINAGLRNENVLRLVTAHSLAVENEMETIIINILKLLNEGFKYRHIVNIQCVLNANTKNTISIDKTVLT